ncbi:membrane-associated guanylate kinase, WW and PDZ domain-containing protein 2-like isoform X2 [Heptranchias perlo]|uniref:membrane-associated guanylate kinase, WW and PDZ domain-containing protein 2-like isoform X2 n=1 Tax=Heptranchias perlo TaxID=212740 RepID=UPI003559504C
MLRKILAVNHWTQKVRETTVSRDEQGVLNLQVQGGAEYGQLIHLGKAQDGKSHYPGGKVQAGDLLLQVNEAPVPGLTLRDTLAMLRNTSQPIRIKTVPQGSQLNCDVRHYLKQSFSKGSADFELQQRIRQNLYIRATPCTMRAPRHDEIPGVDYHFVNLSEFQALERAGGLLESGGFEGNYYGTPVPPIIPVDSGRSPPLTPTPDPPHAEEPPTQQVSAQPGEGVRGGGRQIDRRRPAGRDFPPDSHQSKQTLGRPDVSALIGKVPLTLAHSVVTTITKTNNTFGFTIAGGNKPHELLQIISLASGGPAERSGEMEIHDVVVAVDKISVLGSTHSEVVRLFQAVAEGDRAELQLHRGYPALYKMEPRQLSETNACAPLPSPAPLALIPVALMQSSNGPGFAVEARGSGGGGYARVQRIWDGHRCPCLAVGDLIVKVNGQRVRVLSDEQLDEVLRTHTRAGDVVLLVQRAVKGPAIGTQVSPDSIRCSADGSARPQAGYTERGDGDGAGQPPRKACQRPHGPEAPWSDGPEQKDSGKPPEAITHQRGDEGSELVALSMDKASPGKVALGRWARGVGPLVGAC